MCSFLDIDKNINASISSAHVGFTLFMSTPMWMVLDSDHSSLHQDGRPETSCR